MNLIMGIDPGVHTGIAVFRAGKLVELDEIHPVDLMQYLLSWGPDRVIFEDSRLTTHLFTTSGKAAVGKTMARSVGQVDMVCGMIDKACERLKIAAHGISPKGKGAKLNAAQFKAATGWVGPSNQHQRDSAMVAWGYRTAK